MWRTRRGFRAEVGFRLQESLRLKPRKRPGARLAVPGLFLESLGCPLVYWPITDEGAAVGGAFDSDTAVGIMPTAPSRRRCASILAIAIHQQEVRPINAVSAVGAPLQSTIAQPS